jgi:GT2 family glycosyltransferase
LAVEQARPDARDGRLPAGHATVAICTYSQARWSSLLAATQSILAQLGSADELLVVIDHNDALYHQASSQFAHTPKVRVVRNSAEPGLSGARNTAIAESSRDVIAFLDDDAVAGPDWLPAVLSVLALPDVVAVGTAALPVWPGGVRPRWFPPEFDWVVGCSYEGLPTSRAEVRNVFGGAMAFYRAIAAEAGGFSSSLGRVGAGPAGCEETELCIRIRQRHATARIVYVPDVHIDHLVTPARTRFSYFVRRCVGEGRSKARVSRLVGARDGLSSERAYVAVALPRGVARGLRRAIRGDLGGLGAAAAIAIGLVATTAAYVMAGWGRARRRTIGGVTAQSTAGGPGR